MKLPRSPLEGRATLASKTDDIEDAEIIEVSKEQLEKIPAAPSKRVDEFLNPNVSTVDISAKRMQKSALLDMKAKGQTIADLFDGDASLQEQMGVVEATTRMFTPCMVCALSRKSLEDCEQDLFQHQIDHKTVADKFNLTVSDINGHIQDCVISRRTIIPAGALVNKLVFEINEFIARMDSFRLELDSAMTSEAISTYLSVISELRTAVKDIISMKSPDDEAVLVTKRVFSPLALTTIRELAKSVDSFRKLTEQHVVATSRDDYKRALNEMIREFGVNITTRMLESIRVYCEMNGVKPEVVLGESSDKDKKSDD